LNLISSDVNGISVNSFALSIGADFNIAESNLLDRT
jgi:hypothetical protein